MRVFENRVLRRMTERKKEEVIGIQRKWHNEELRTVFRSPKYYKNHKIKEK
jgi:hypothetical protein